MRTFDFNFYSKQTPCCSLDPLTLLRPKRGGWLYAAGIQLAAWGPGYLEDMRSRLEH